MSKKKTSKRAKRGADSRAASCSASKPTRQTIAEVPPGLEWTRLAALRLISMSSEREFPAGEDTWGKWCRSVAGAGLGQDAGRLEWLAKDRGYPLPRSGERQIPDEDGAL